MPEFVWIITGISSNFSFSFLLLLLYKEYIRKKNALFVLTKVLNDSNLFFIFYFFPKRKQHGNGRFPSENASKMLNSPHFLVTKMPYSIPSNATLYHRKCHTLCLLKCGVLPVKM
jgi:hypothetical protein